MYTGTSTSPSLDCRTFAGPWFTSVAGTDNQVPVENNVPELLPEIVSSLFGDGFPAHFRRPYYQHLAAANILKNFGINYPGICKYVRSRGLIEPIHTMYFAQPWAAASPISHPGLVPDVRLLKQFRITGSRVGAYFVRADSH